MSQVFPCPAWYGASHGKEEWMDWLERLFAFAAFFNTCWILWGVLSVKEMLKQHDEGSADERADDRDGEL